MTSNSCILWEGDSLLNGKPIVVILTGLEKPSANRKTGWMIQSWIILQDLHPFPAIQTQADEAICGQCPLRGGACYVDLRPVYNLFHRYRSGAIPKYGDWADALIRNYRRPLRLGAYGDPAAAPLEAWLPILQSVPDWTGYTHQWRSCDPRWRDYLMASVESEPDAALAHAAGWRTYRIVLPDEPLMGGEHHCPHLLNKAIQCDRCGLCSGTSGKGKGNIAELVHGTNWKIDRFVKQKERFNVQEEVVFHS